MNCEEIQNKLSLLIDGRLDENEQVSVNQHLEDCPVCREYYRKLLKLESMADEFEIGGDENYWISQKDAILDRIEQAESKQITPVPSRRSRDIFYRIAAVAAAVALVASISIFESRQVEPVKGIFYRQKPSDEISTVARGEKRRIAEGEDTVLSRDLKVEAEPLVEEAVIEGQLEESAGRVTSEPQEIAKKGKPLPVETTMTELIDEVVPAGDVIVFDAEIKEKEDLTDLNNIISIPEPVVVQADEFTVFEEMAVEKSDTGPREIISEESLEPDIAAKKAGGEADQADFKSGLTEQAADAAMKAESEADRMSEFQPEEEPATSLVEEIDLSTDSESLRFSALSDSDEISRAKSAFGIAPQESAAPEMEIPLVDVDEPVLGVTRASLDPSIFGDFTEEQKQQYVELRNKVDWYNSRYAYVYSPHRGETMANARIKLSEDSLHTIVYSMAEAYHGLGVMTPIKDECSRMLDLMKKLRKQADKKLITKLDIYIGELEDRLD